MTFKVIVQHLHGQMTHSKLFLPSYFFLIFRTFKCKCILQELQSYEFGVGKNKKTAKSDSAKRTIEMISHIPDVQSVIISIMMSSNLNETFLNTSNDLMQKSKTPFA